MVVSFFYVCNFESFFLSSGIVFFVFVISWLICWFIWFFVGVVLVIFLIESVVFCCVDMLSII